MTAVEWCFRWVNDNPEATHKEYSEAFEQAKEMEKQQIIDAWSKGYDEDDRASSSPLKYYAETYGSGVFIEEDAKDGLYDKPFVVCEDCGMEECICNTSSQTEMSDEEIEKESDVWSEVEHGPYIFKEAIKWYREQLRNRK